MRLAFGSSKGKTKPIKEKEPDYDHTFVLIHKEGKDKVMYSLTGTRGFYNNKSIETTSVRDTSTREEVWPSSFYPRVCPASYP